MAPSKAAAAAAPYSKDERVLCFHHEMLYEAKVLDCRPTEDGLSWQFKIHYKGWKNTWDDWVPQDRVRKFTDENKELASQLHAQMKVLQQRTPATKSITKKGSRANGSDFSSARGSEERHTSMTAQSGRGGPRRNRDYDLEQSKVNFKEPNALREKLDPSYLHYNILEFLTCEHTQVWAHFEFWDALDLTQILALISQHLLQIIAFASAMDDPGLDEILQLVIRSDQIQEERERRINLASGLSSASSLLKPTNPLGIVLSTHEAPAEDDIPGSPMSSELSFCAKSPTTPPGLMEPTSPSPAAKRRKLSEQYVSRAKPEPSKPCATRASARTAGLPAPNAEGSWMNPASADWDVVRFLNAHHLHGKDDLLKRPPTNYSYIDGKGKLKDPLKYDTSKLDPIAHPDLVRHIDNGTDSKVLHQYYQDLPRDQHLPIAGIIRENQFDELFRDQILTQNLHSQEEGFHSRPSIKLVIPDHLKAILVDDWENVTKNQQLVPLPSPHPVNSILADYLASEKPKREPGSASADILEEVIAGLKEYFEKCLGRILLYRFERSQYIEMRELWASNKEDWAGKSAGDTYGAEHLCRLLVSLPELIAQTNMDQQSVNRLREELAKMTNWLGKNALEYFASEYETPSQNYIDKARS